MKKLLLFASILVSNLTSYSQVVVGPPPGTDPNPNPNFICGARYCFTNTTGCYVSITIDVHAFNETCLCDYVTSSYEPIYLAAGQSGCIERVVCENGCVLCPSMYTFNICGSNGSPCFSITDTETGGQGMINCDGPYQLVNWHWDPATGTYIITE